MSQFKPYPAYKDSGVEWLGDVPGHWWNVPIKYMALERKSLFLDGDWIESKDISAGNIRYITTGNVGEGEYKEQGAGFISDETFRALNCTEVYEGDLLVSRLNSPIGRACIVPDLGTRVVTSVDNVIFRPDRNFHKKFIVYLFSSKEYFEHTGNLARGATMQRISRGLLGNIRIIALPMEEQTQIARFLDHETARIDALIEEQHRLIELLKEKRQAVISHSVTKGLDPTVPMKDSRVEWLGEVPAHWGFKQSKYLFEFVTSGSRGWAEYYSDDGDLFFRIANLTRDSIEPKLATIQYVTPPSNAEGERSKVRLGDILISITADLGSVCVANDAVVGSYVSQHVALARPICKSVFARWLAYFVLSSACKDQLVGAGYGGTKVQLSLDDIRSFWVSMPSYEEQVSLAAFLDKEIKSFDGLIMQASIGVDLLSERRSALISAAVTGKIDVRGWQPPARVSSPVLEEEAV